MVNTLVLAIDNNDNDGFFNSVYAAINFVCTVVYVFELLLKFTALGVVDTLKDKMNFIDLAIVFVSLLEVIHKTIT